LPIVSPQGDGSVCCKAWVQTSNGQQTTQIGRQNGNTQLVVTVTNITPYNLTYIGLDATSTYSLVKFPQGNAWTETGVNSALVPPMNSRSRNPLERKEYIWNPQSPKNLQEVVALKVRYSAQPPLIYSGAQTRGIPLQPNPITLSFTHQVDV